MSIVTKNCDLATYLVQFAHLIGKEIIMYKLIITIIGSLLISSCSYFHIYRPDKQQGNEFNNKMTNQVHVGMSEKDVKKIMGTPTLTNTFDANRVSYVYTFKPGYGGDMTQKHVTFVFKNGKVSKIEKDLGATKKRN
jgi:outer membrane protein assembly factor BamE